VLIDKIDVQVHGPGRERSDCSGASSQICRCIPVIGLSHAAYEAIKNDLPKNRPATYGYLDARLTRNELGLIRRATKASVALEMDTGERYHFGGDQHRADGGRRYVGAPLPALTARAIRST